MKLHKLLLMGILASGLMLSACNTNQDSTKPSGDDSSDTSGDDTPSGGETTQWEEITYSEFKAFYDSKEDAPYNHLEYDYGDSNGYNPDGTLKMFHGVEDLIDGVWTVDEEHTEGGGGDVTTSMILDQEGLEMYANPPAGTTVVFKVYGTEKFALEVEMTQGSNAVHIECEMDKYFYATSFLQQANGIDVIKCLATWSAK